MVSGNSQEEAEETVAALELGRHRLPIIPKMEVELTPEHTPRGKWDFSSDEKLLEAHQIKINDDQYQYAWKDGHAVGVASKNDWSAPISGAIIMSVLLICATAIAIMRPEYFIDVHPIAIHLGDPIAPHPGSF